MFRLGKSTKKKIEAKSLTAKVKDDVVPRVNEAVHNAVERTAPARSEAKARTSAAWHALRGDYPHAAAEKKGRGKATAAVVGAAGAVAAVGAAAWATTKRLRTPDWVSNPDDTASMPSPTARSETKPAMRAKARPAADDEAGASPDEALADMAESSYDGAQARR